MSGNRERLPLTVCEGNRILQSFYLLLVGGGIPRKNCTIVAQRRSSSKRKKVNWNSDEILTDLLISPELQWQGRFSASVLYQKHQIEKSGRTLRTTSLICSFPQLNFQDENSFWIVLIIHDALLSNYSFAAMKLV